jgi:hypothetical protein
MQRRPERCTHHKYRISRENTTEQVTNMNVTIVVKPASTTHALREKVNDKGTAPP